MLFDCSCTFLFTGEVVYKQMLFCFFIFIFLIISIIFLTPLTISLLLVFSSLFLAFVVGLNFLSRGLLLFAILLVYIGAMIIIIGYVCAVSPNPFYGPSLSPLLSVIFSTLLRLTIYFSFDYFHPITSSTPFSSVSYLYGFIGLSVFFTLLFYIFIVLYSASSFTQVNSPFRSI